jgi:hypothetical protein
MPLEERLQEPRPFDVYAMMMIVAFLAVGGACLIINYELRGNWYGGEEPVQPHAVNVTTINGQTEQQAHDTPSTWTLITQRDMDDFKLLRPTEELKPTPYPSWLDPNAPAFSTDLDKDNTEKVPPAEAETMIKSYAEKDPTAGVTAEEEKKP